MKNRIFIRLWLTLLMAMALLLEGSTAGWAGNVSGCSNHCYAGAEFNPNFFLAQVTQHIDFSKLYEATHDGGSFVTNELFMYTTSDTTNWVELGVTAGYSINGVLYGPSVFYAQKAPGVAYNEHYPSVAISPNTDFAQAIHNHGGGVWVFQQSGVGAIGNDSGNPNNAGYVALAASETYTVGTANVGVCTNSGGLEYEVDGSSTIYSGWPGSTIPFNNPGNPFSWVTTNSNYHMNVGASC